MMRLRRKNTREEKSLSRKENRTKEAIRRWEQKLEVPMSTDGAIPAMATPGSETAVGRRRRSVVYRRPGTEQGLKYVDVSNSSDSEGDEEEEGLFALSALSIHDRQTEAKRLQQLEQAQAIMSFLDLLGGREA